MSLGIFTASVDTQNLNNANVAEPAIPLSVDALGERLLEAIEDTALVDPGIVPLIDASTDPEALPFSATVLTILDATDADDGFTEPAQVVGLANETTDDVLAMGFADPLTGELFAVGISGDLVANGAVPSDAVPSDAVPSDAIANPLAESVYIMSDASSLTGLSVFVFSGLDSEAAVVLEPSLDVRPNASFGATPPPSPETGFAANAVADAAIFSPAALLAPDMM